MSLIRQQFSYVIYEPFLFGSSSVIARCLVISFYCVICSQKKNSSATLRTVTILTAWGQFISSMATEKQTYIMIISFRLTGRFGSKTKLYDFVSLVCTISLAFWNQNLRLLTKVTRTRVHFGISRVAFKRVRLCSFSCTRNGANILKNMSSIF